LAIPLGSVSQDPGFVSDLSLTHITCLLSPFFGGLKWSKDFCIPGKNRINYNSTKSSTDNRILMNEAKTFVSQNKTELIIIVQNHP
jgi:hypothetical protein